MNKTNGTATYQAWTGGSKSVIKTVRARITPKRVATSTRQWDRAGKRVSAYHVGMMTITLLGYQIDGEPPVVIREPS